MYKDETSREQSLPLNTAIPVIQARITQDVIKQKKATVEVSTIQ